MSRVQKDFKCQLVFKTLYNNEKYVLKLLDATNNFVKLKTTENIN